MGYKTRGCFHRWSKNGICTSPGCFADQKDVGLKADDVDHKPNPGSYDGSINGIPVRQKDRKK